MAVRLGEHEVRLARTAVRFPVELRLPTGFDPHRVTTWPDVDGRLEYVAGRLLFMPPTGDVQQDVAVDVAFTLRSWSATHAEFVVGGNEAGMILGGDVRAADCAVWRRTDLGEHSGGYRRVPPVLAVEIAGRDDDEASLREKARWYFDHGVAVVWLVLPAARSVIVLDAFGAEQIVAKGDLPSHVALPDLHPPVDSLFAQLDGR